MPHSEFRVRVAYQMPISPATTQDEAEQRIIQVLERALGNGQSPYPLGIGLWPGLAVHQVQAEVTGRGLSDAPHTGGTQSVQKHRGAYEATPPVTELSHE
jgi:hypothetical protein